MRLLRSRGKVREWMLGVMAEQATALGVADPAGLARQLSLLYDGALTQSRLDHGRAAATAAKTAAEILIETSLHRFEGRGHDRPQAPRKTHG